MGVNKTYWFLVERIDGKELAVFPDRHDAVGFKARMHAGKDEWYSVQKVNPVAYLDWKPRMTPDCEPYRAEV